MTILDVGISFVGVVFSGWLLTQWWRQDERVAVLGRHLTIGFIVIASFIGVAWIAYGQGVRNQYEADYRSLTDEWKTRLDASVTLSTHVFRNEVAKNDEVEAIKRMASTNQVPTDFITFKSFLLLAWLWVVLGFVSSVPPIRSKPKAKGADGREND